jgi:hypothetical protein
VSARAREWAVVGLGAVVVVAAAAAWMAVDRTPPEWDHANHLERVVHCAGDLQHGDWRAILERSSFYPPLVPCAAAVVYRGWPSDTFAAQAIVWGFLALGMAATYVLAREFAGGAGGALAGLLFGTAPFTLFLTLHFQLDLPLAAMVSVFLVTLLTTADFHDGRRSILAGLVFALGMLTKPTFAAYVLPVVFVVAARVRGRRAATNLALGALIAIVASLPWYGPRLFGLSGQIGRRSFEQAAQSGHPAPFSFAGLSFYPTWLIPQFGVLAVLLLCLGVAVALRRRCGFLLVGLLVPFVLVVVIQNKNLRYTLPLLPVAAALAGMGFASLPRRARVGVATLVGIAAALQVTATTLAWPPALTLPGLRVPWVFASPPRGASWHQREILDVIARDHGEKGGQAGPARISVVPNNAYFSVSNFRYYALRDGRAMTFTRAWDDDPIGVEYMILKTGEVGPEWTAAKPRRIDARFASDPSLTRVFPVLAELPLPDGSRATVRVRRVPSDLAVAPAALAGELEAAFRRRLPAFARDVDGLRIALVYDGAIRRGWLARVEIAVAAATLGEFERRDAGLHVRDLRLVIDDVLVNPFAAHAAGRFEPLDIGRVRIAQATLTAEDLHAFLAGQKRARGTRLTLGAGYADLMLERSGPDVSARVRLAPAPDRPFAILAERVRVGGIAVPDLIAHWVVRTLDPSRRIASRLPVPVEIGEVRIDRDAIRIMSAR